MKIRKWLSLGLVTVLALGLLGLAGCSGDGGSDEAADGEFSGALSVEGSDTLVNVGQAWAETFMTENEGVMISVKGGGSGNGIAALINGTVDFANASREMKPEEKEQLDDPVEHVVAKDGVSVAVNPSNPVAGLTTDQIGRIYRGEITNWRDVGGPDTEIVVLSRDSSSGTYEFFKEAVVSKDDENADYAQTVRNLPSNQAIVDEVKANADAIGYVGIGYATEAGSAIKVIDVDGTQATPENVQTGTYVLSRDLYMYSNGEPDGLAAAYLEWIQGDEGQAIVEDQGFVALR